MQDWLASVGALAVSWMLRASVILVIALLAVRLLQHRSAALRHGALTAGVIAALIAPPFSALPLTAFIPASAAPWLSDTRAETPNAAPLPLAPSGNQLAPRSSLPTPERSLSLWEISTIVWLGGIVLLLLRQAIGAIAAMRVRRQSRPVSDRRLLRLVKGRAELRVSDRIAAPATLGILRPTVLLPADAADWETDCLRSILAHELAHVARRDCLTTLLAEVACAVHWINPLIWIARRRIVLERERACDDAALLAGAEPTQYGLLLLDAARASYAQKPLAAVISMARPSQLESRLVAIVRGDGVARDRLSRRALAVIVLSSVLLGTAAASHAAQPAQQRGEPEPDLRGDSIAPWTSERVPLPDLTGLEARVRGSALWHGPDRAIVREFARHVGHAGDPEELYRERAAWALTLATGNSLIEPVLGALGDADWRVKAYAAWTLGYARERRAVPTLIQLLEHRVWRMRAMAASALLQIGDPSALPALTKALEDEAWQVRTPAVSFVAAYADSVTARRLLEPRLRDRHVAVRRAASQALGVSARNP